MKKKVLSLVLAGAMTMGLALTGCSGGGDGGSDSGDAPAAEDNSGSEDASGGSEGGDKPYGPEMPKTTQEHRLLWMRLPRSWAWSLRLK